METSGRGLGHAAKDELGEREDEATSKETLKDLEQKEKSSGAPDETHEKPLSPDGALDESRELKDADPT
ncbi:MAG TPA: hypothetical protein VF074_21810 [Pyrinomonadaceae bacterium]